MHLDVRKHKMSWVLAEAIGTQLILEKNNKIALKLYKQAIFAGSSMCLQLLGKKGLLYHESKRSRNVAIINP